MQAAAVSHAYKVVKTIRIWYDTFSNGRATCRCTSCRSARNPSLNHLVSQLAALAAAAAAAPEAAPSRAPSVATPHGDAFSEADNKACPWFKCPISLVSPGNHACCHWAFVPIAQVTLAKLCCRYSPRKTQSCTHQVCLSGCTYLLWCQQAQPSLRM